MPFEFPSDPDDINNVIIQAGEGNLEMVQRVLPSLGMGHADSNGYSCVHAAAAYCQLDVLRWLLTNGCDVNIRDGDGDTPLHHCDKVEAAQMLVSFGADVFAKNGDNRTALGRANGDVIKEDDDEYDEDDDENNALKAVVAYLRTFVGQNNQAEALLETGDEPRDGDDDDDDDDDMDDDNV